MLEIRQDAQERWDGVHLLIDRWLAERRDLLEAFDSVVRQQTIPAASAEALQVFCELLVDYVSAGHFEVYEQLMGEAESFGDRRGLGLARQIYPRLEAITQAALASTTVWITAIAGWFAEPGDRGARWSVARTLRTGGLPDRSAAQRALADRRQRLTLWRRPLPPVRRGRLFVRESFACAGFVGGCESGE